SGSHPQSRSRRLQRDRPRVRSSVRREREGACTMKYSELGIDDELLSRLAGPGPRYTSYPTVPEWKDATDVDARTAYAKAALAIDEPLALYVHIPFCARLCYFCG